MLKKIISLTFLVLSISTFSQKFQIGIKSGLNLSTLKFKGEYFYIIKESETIYAFSSTSTYDVPVNTLKNNLIAAPLFSFYGQTMLHKNIFLKAEIGYSKQGTIEKISNTQQLFGWEGSYPSTIKGELKTVTSYINVPLLVKYKLTEKIYTELGTQMSFLINSTEKIDANITNGGYTGAFQPSEVISKDAKIEHNFGIINFGACLGIGYNLNDRLSIDLRYIRQKINRSLIIENPTIKYMSSSFQISINFVLNSRSEEF